MCEPKGLGKEGHQWGDDMHGRGGGAVCPVGKKTVTKCKGKMVEKTLQVNCTSDKEIHKH